MKELLTLIPLAVVLTTGAPQAADADSEGKTRASSAIAIDSGRDVVSIGISAEGVDHTREVALSKCRKTGIRDGVDCSIAIQKQTPSPCIAVAFAGAPLEKDVSVSGWGSADTYNQAVANAMSDCKRKGGGGCRLAEASCPGGTR